MNNYPLGLGQVYPASFVFLPERQGASKKLPLPRRSPQHLSTLMSGRTRMVLGRALGQVLADLRATLSLFDSPGLSDFQGFVERTDSIVSGHASSIAFLVNLIES